MIMKRLLLINLDKMLCPSNLTNIDIKLSFDIDVDILKKYITNKFKVKLCILFGDPHSFINIKGGDNQNVNAAAMEVTQIIMGTLLINTLKPNI